MSYAGRMLTPATVIRLTSRQKATLENLARAGTTTQRLARRCRVILLAAQGTPNRAIAQQVGTSRPTVLAIRAMFARGGMEGLRQEAATLAA